VAARRTWRGIAPVLVPRSAIAFGAAIGSRNWSWSFATCAWA